MRIYLSGFIYIFLCLFLSACGDTSIHNVWKGTVGLYYEYLNPPASIDYDDFGNISKAEDNLARNMLAIDTSLTSFERYMINQDKPPSSEMVNDLLERFRFVSGVAAISASGEVLAEQPANIKQIDFAKLLEVEPKNPRGLRAMVEKTSFGPEILLGASVFNGFDLQGLYIAHFDIRLLLDNVPNAQNLFIVSDDTVLYSCPATGSLEAHDWTKEIESRTSGTVSTEEGSFVWLSRYLGNLPLIFASSVEIKAVEQKTLPKEGVEAVGETKDLSGSVPEETKDIFPLSPPKAATEEQSLILDESGKVVDVISVPANSGLSEEAFENAAQSGNSQ